MFHCRLTTFPDGETVDVLPSGASARLCWTLAALPGDFQAVSPSCTRRRRYGIKKYKDNCCDPPSPPNTKPFVEQDLDRLRSSTGGVAWKQTAKMSAEGLLVARRLGCLDALEVLYGAISAINTI